MGKNEKNKESEKKIRIEKERLDWFDLHFPGYLNL